MPPLVPLATYRLQLTPRFGFDDAASVVPFLQALGISHLYASPFLMARSGSTHGYDIIDYSTFNPELGGEAGFERLCQALAKADMGLILDFVPNHMAIHYADNSWWLDVLEWGPKSPHAAAFDIDWQFFTARPRVLVPILGTPYGEALDEGRIELRFNADEGSFSAWYHEHRLPIAPGCYSEVLETVVGAADARTAPAGRCLLELAAKNGPSPGREQACALKAKLASIVGGRDLIGRGLQAYQPQSGEVARCALHELLERQHYRLAHWRLAASEINYRRFFDINTLAGVCVEHQAVFEAVHTLVRRLIASGRLQGLRIDHVDGLYDPRDYCWRLERLINSTRQAPDHDVYVVVEKVLGDCERLPPFAGVAGTTGYEWLNLISRLLVDHRGLEALTRSWQRASGDARSFAEHLIAAKREVLSDLFASEFAALVRLLEEIAAAHYATRDYAGARLRAAFELFVLNFPVYRTYVTPSGASPTDRETIERTLAKARAEWVGADIGIFDFLRNALMLDLAEWSAVAETAAKVRRFALKVQQLTGPVMAKSLEDTAFYRYHRLLAFNEVGGNPAAGALSVSDFHARMTDRAVAPSQGLTATATHDTKRGEDARARLMALSELADEWEQKVQEWSELSDGLISDAGNIRAPSPAHECMLYQTLLGAWPLDGVDDSFVERIIAYAIKAAREGKQQTSWLAANAGYESGLKTFVARLLDPRCSQRFIDDFAAFARRSALLGALNSLVQLTLKATIPGVPDFYQSVELWDLSLVDPDNRQPVDFSARAILLPCVGTPVDWPELADQWADGRIKLALTHRLLELRRRFSSVFAKGGYEPLALSGLHKNEIVAFARMGSADAVIIVCGRLFGRVTDYGRRWPSVRDWDAWVALPTFSNVSNLLTGELVSGSELAISEIFSTIPIAILHAHKRGH